MPKTGELIDVYDTDKEKYILQSATREEVAQKLEIPTRKISTNLYNGCKVYGRYKLELSGSCSQDQNKKSTKKKNENKKSALPINLLAEWDNVRLMINPNAKPTPKEVINK